MPTVLSNALRRKSIAIPLILALVIALGGSLFQFVTPGVSSQSTPQAYQSILRILSGNVEIQFTGSTAWQEVTDGMRLMAGDRVKTAPNSHAVLTFFEGSTIKLEPNTIVDIQQAQRVDEKSTEIVLKQWLGKTWSRVVKMGDSGSRYELETPSGWLLVRGTMFETEVDETGSTTVRVSEGLVSVRAQNEEVHVSAGQEVRVESGASPSQPMPIAQTNSQLVITVDGVAVASVYDPSGSSTGYLPSGFEFNQISGAQSSSPALGSQVTTIPSPLAGEYSIVLRSIDDGTIWIRLDGLSTGKTSSKQVEAYEVTAGSEWLITVNLEVEGGRISSASISDIEPLGDRAPEKIVITELTEESLQPIEQVLDGVARPAPTPSTTLSPTPTQALTPTPSTILLPTPTPNMTPTPSTTLSPTPTPSVTSTPEPTPMPTPTPSVTSTPEPTPMPTPTPSVTSTPAPTPMPTPTPSAAHYYLHNNPTPPTGDTNSIGVLPMDKTAPTTSILYNYAQDQDDFAGLLIQKSDIGVNETDPDKYQVWRSGALSSDQPIVGMVTVELWSAVKDYGQGKVGAITVFLRDYNGSSYTEIGNGILQELDWQGGVSNWVKKTFTIGGLDHTIPAGNKLEVKLIVNDNSDDDLRFAYDTISYPSVVIIP